jgi:hypothetical protein
VILVPIAKPADYIPKSGLNPLHRGSMQPSSLRCLDLSQPVEAITHRDPLRLRQSR